MRKLNKADLLRLSQARIREGQKIAFTGSVKVPVKASKSDNRDLPLPTSDRLTILSDTKAHKLVRHIPVIPEDRLKPKREIRYRQPEGFTEYEKKVWKGLPDCLKSFILKGGKK